MPDLQQPRVDDNAATPAYAQTGLLLTTIRTPDQRVRVFVSSTLEELAPERGAAREAITRLRLTPVLFELGARPHPPRELYRAYLAQSDVFVGLYWQRYGWVAPGMDISGLEDEYRLAGDKPRLIYVKRPAAEREPGLQALLQRIQADDTASYKPFATPDELRELIENDLALLLTERFARASAAAPLAPDEQPRTNLPALRDPLIDRTGEAAAARDLLLSEDVGMVTLTGPGGAGKTRLALHVAANLRDHFEDGVFLVPLAPVTTPPMVASTIAQTLAARQDGSRPVVEFLQDYLRAKRMLLVLDNFEQVVSAAPLVAAVLDTCARLKILVTSREPLHVRGEKELPVPPLALPDPAHLPDVESLSHYAAVELFLRRVQGIAPTFTLTAENAQAVAEICRRLDGLPLAIELAAARVRLLPPRALLARLQRRLPLLTDGARDLPARQQTMRDAIAWSYDLLDEGEMTLFRRLAVFAGGCTLAAIEAVCNAARDLPLDVLEGVGSLVDKSLLRSRVIDSSPGGEGDEPRFDMLDTIREYALERLADSGEEKSIRRTHAAYYLALVDEADSHLRGAEQHMWLERLGVERDNVRAALGWRETGPSDTETGWRLAGAVSWFWFLRGYLGDGEGWLDDALAWNYDLLDEREQPLFRRCAVFAGGWTLAAVKAVCLEPAVAVEEAAGSLSLQTPVPERQSAAGSSAGKLTAEARAATAEARAATDEDGELGDEMGSLVDTGLLQHEESASGEPRFAMRSIIRDYALKRLQETGEEDAVRRRHAAYYLALTEAAEPHLLGAERDTWLDRLDVERDNLLAALKWSDAAQGDPQVGLRLAGALSWYWLLRGRIGEGRATLESALARDKGPASTPARASALYGAGGLAAVQGDYVAARPRLEESAAVFRAVGDAWGLAQALASAGDVAAHLEDHNQAQALFMESLALCNKLGHKAGIDVCFAALAEVAAVQGQLRQAARLLGAVHTPLDASDFVLNGPDQAAFERDIVDLRGRLGEAAFAAAWAEGQAMTPEQAIASAAART